MQVSTIRVLLHGSALSALRVGCRLYFTDSVLCRSFVKFMVIPPVLQGGRTDRKCSVTGLGWCFWYEQIQNLGLYLSVLWGSRVCCQIGWSSRRMSFLLLLFLLFLLLFFRLLHLLPLLPPVLSPLPLHFLRLSPPSHLLLLLLLLRRTYKKPTFP